MTAGRIDRGAVVSGLVLVTVGTLMLIGRFTDYDFGDIVHNYWPMILIIIGIPKLLDYRTLWSGLWLIALGSWMQVAHLHLFGMSWHNSWPLLLVILGIGSIARAVFEVITQREEHHEG
jgi:hypothetical protein